MTSPDSPSPRTDPLAMPPALPGETDEQYTDRLTGADRTGRVPYAERRFRQCSIGYHDECSQSAERRPDLTDETRECRCPCHALERERAAQEAPAPEGLLRSTLSLTETTLAERLRSVLINRGINPAFADDPAAAVFGPGNAVADAPPSPAEPPRPDPDALTAAYRERAMVVAALFRVGGYRPVVVPAPDAPGWWIVYAETPEGQVSWHIAEADLPIFEGTGWKALGTYEWDGHTTDEKYERLSRLRAEARPPEGLDEAWAAAEAALPEGSHLCDLIHDRQGWTISAWPDDHSNDLPAVSYGPAETPTAALLALATRLSARGAE